MKSRLIIVAVFAGIIGLLLLIGSIRSAMRPKPQEQVVLPALVSVVELAPAPYTATETFHGLFVADAAVDLAFQVDGRLVSLGEPELREGDVVKRGQPLASLDAALLYAQLEQARGGEAQAIAMVETAQARRDDAALELERFTRLVTTDATNQRELERSQTSLRISEAELIGAQANVTAAKAMLYAAQVRLDYASLMSPIDGRVAAVSVEVGQMVTPATTAMRLVRISPVRLLLGVVERKLPMVHPGQTVKVFVAALNRTVEGVVDIVPPAADVNTGLFRVEVLISNEDEAIRPGMIGKAVVTTMSDQLVMIPADATLSDGDERYAFFVERDEQGGGVARRVVLHPMMTDRQGYLFKSSPSPTPDWPLIVRGQQRLYDGQRVEVFTASGGGGG